MNKYDQLFYDDVTTAIKEVTDAYGKDAQKTAEYPLALLNAYGMMIASQLKRQADELVKINEGLAHILEAINNAR